MRLGRVAWGLLAAMVVAAAFGGHADARMCHLYAQRLHTHPEFGAIRYCVVHHAERSTATGNLFLALWKSHGNGNALMILTRDGRLVWYRTNPTGVRDLKVVKYGGRRMLAYYEWGTRAYSLLDNHYREVARIHTIHLLTDMHDFEVTAHGTAYLASYHNRRLSTNGPLIRDYTVQEVDIRTGKLLFEWTAGDHLECFPWCELAPVAMEVLAQP